MFYSIEGCRDGKVFMCGGLREVRIGGGVFGVLGVRSVLCFLMFIL